MKHLAVHKIMYILYEPMKTAMNTLHHTSRPSSYITTTVSCIDNDVLSDLEFIGIIVQKGDSHRLINITPSDSAAEHNCLNILGDGQCVITI